MIKEGYKRTDLGIIPESWEIKELSKITSLITNGFVGKATDHYTTSEDGVLYIQGYNVDGFEFNFNGIKYVTKEFHLKNKKSILKKGDLLTIQTGDVGLTAYVPKELEGSNCHALIITRYIKDKAHSKFYHQYFNSIIGRYRLSRIETGSTMKHINCGDLKKLLIPIPPLPEQQAIANCLTTWDSGIEKLTQLIATKREQKKGLMQLLLTGKKRLEGFVGEWKEVKIGKLGETFNGLTGKTKKDFGEGKPYVTYLNTFRQNCIDENTSFDYVKINDNENQSTLKYGDLIFTTSSETPNEVGMSSVILFHPKDSLYLNSFCFGLRLENFETLHPSFATFMLRGNDFRREMYKLAQGSTRFNLSKASFKKITVKLPPIEEQTAIAHILTTADKEIALLEKKLEAMKEEKKGLMQVLLTGEKRLV